MRFMRGLVGVAPVLIILAMCQPAMSQAAAQKKTAPAPAQSPAARGRYLVMLGGCHDCHTPKIKGEVDFKRQFMGHPANEKVTPVPNNLLAPDKWGALTNNHLTAWVGPWGVSYAANLTPDKNTGLGSWTPQMFVQAIRTGKNRGTGRAILPPMPWVMYKDVTDADLRAIFAYLQSLPPINNLVPPPLPPNMIPR